MLTSLIRKPSSKVPEETPEDILDNTSLTIFNPDAQRTFHGDPGSSIIYASKRYGDIRLQLADPQGRDERWLFAHHLWNSSVLLAELISNEAGRAMHEGEAHDRDASTIAKSDIQKDFERPGRWSVRAERVLELGAGTALASITSLLSHATQVFISDYPTPTILSTIHTNLSANIPPALQPLASVSGHEWGCTTDALTAGHAYSFTRIIACDCLWLDGEHEALAKSMRHFLSTDPGARVWVVAGWHTGKRKVAAFFRTARRRARLEVEGRWEVDTDFRAREWVEPGEGEGEGESLGDRNRWMVVAVLRIAEGDVVDGG